MSEDQLVEVDGLKYIENILNLFDEQYLMNDILFLFFNTGFDTRGAGLLQPREQWGEAHDQGGNVD